MAGNSSIACSVYRGIQNLPHDSIYAQDNTSKSAVSVHHHKTTELPYMELHNFMPSQQTSHFVLGWKNKLHVLADF